VRRLKARHSAGPYLSERNRHCARTGYIKHDNDSVEGEEANVDYRRPIIVASSASKAGWINTSTVRAGVHAMLVNNLGYRQSDEVWSAPSRQERRADHRFAPADECLAGVPLTTRPGRPRRRRGHGREQW